MEKMMAAGETGSIPGLRCAVSLFQNAAGDGMNKKSRDNRQDLLDESHL